MKKYLILGFFLVVLSSFALAQTQEITYCTGSLSQYSERELQDLGISQEMISSQTDCVCFGPLRGSGFQ
jgi:hypothetical protein